MAPTFGTNIDEGQSADLLQTPTASTSAESQISPNDIATAVNMITKTWSVIPSKFLTAPQHFVRNELGAVGGFQRHGKGFVKVTTSQNAPTPPTSLSPALSPAPKTSAPSEGLPEVPTWAMHAFAGCASFVLIVAIVLYIAQFPPDMSWLRKRPRWKKSGYMEIGQEEDNGNNERRYRGKSSAVAATQHTNGVDTRTGTLRQRKPRNLSIETGATYKGLGIAVPRDEEAESSRRSFDVEALRQPAKSPVRVTWESFTAPLPSVSDFMHGKRIARQSTLDVEDGHGESRSLSASTPDMFDLLSPYHAGARTRGTTTQGSAFLNKVNGSIYQAADRLSRTFYDQVQGPEEGLLLPVHQREREAPLTAGVFVD
ncbi:hypothetical protein LTR37_008043 [Vermiconidia calcicola]|uniref:Uncharacterized protein n=1 Tax=Vermiconidia calcicola TaxID=1690605 RepID=A0ACC3NBL1_9PEZI|nr:hypothetical protein LTR37_008043 [Vermiconidia calcicola]